MLLQRRSNQIYYFRWVCPERVRQIVGKSELIRSLNTPNQLVAYARASRYYEAVQKITYLLQMNRLSEEQLAAIIQRIWDRLQVTLATPLTFEMVDFNDGADEWIDDILEEVSALRDVFDPRENRYTSRHENWPELLTDYGLDPSAYHAEDRDRLHQELLRIRHEFFLDRITQIENFKKNPPSPFSTIVKRRAPVEGVLFSELYREFIAYKVKVNNLSEKMQADYQRQYNDVIEILGDIPIEKIGRNTLKDFILTQYRYLPKRNLKPYKDKTASELLQMEDIPEEHLIAGNTVTGLVKMLQGLFAFAVERGHLAVSPAYDIKIKLGSKNPYGAYKNSQVRRMLDAAAKEPGWKRWLPLLAAYTGARLGEIVQLRKSDFLMDEYSGRHYIRIIDDAGSVKTEAGNRRVPLHLEIMEAGFKVFVERSGEVLFPALKSSVVTGWFPRFRESLGIPRVDDMNSRLVFHSFRHSFITNARSHGVLDPSLIQQVVGHEKVSFGVTDLYTHPYAIKDFCRVVDAVDYGSVSAA